MRQLKDESSSANKFLPDRAVLIVADPKVVTVIAHRLLDISTPPRPATIAPNRAVGVMTLVHLDAQLLLDRSDGAASSQRSKIHMLLVRALDKAHREAALPGRDRSVAVCPSAPLATYLACVHMGRHTHNCRVASKRACGWVAAARAPCEGLGRCSVRCGRGVAWLAHPS